MSVDRCSRCSNLVDTDNEPEAYVEVAMDVRGNPDYICLCRGCRERHEEEMEREASEPRRMPTDWTPTAAQQAIMDAAPEEDET